MIHELETADGLDERQFMLAVRRLADSLMFGTDSSPYKGSGVDYVETRPYQPGDPIKQMDWKVTARTGRHHVKDYEAPKHLPVYLLVDTSASMCVRSGGLSKYGWAVQLAGGLALAALARISPVGVLGCGTRDFHIQPSLSRERVFVWLHQLRRFRFDEGTELGSAARKLAALLAERCLIVALTDFHDPDGPAALRMLAQRHDCIALQLQDPAERGGLRAGIIRAQEAETGRGFVAAGGRGWGDGEWVADEMRKGGIDHLLLRTDEPFVPRLRFFLQSRGGFGRGAR